MHIVSRPVAIKHCLHTFCKHCFDEQVLKYRKNCPLCKVTVVTKRESRQHGKLTELMRLLNIQESAPPVSQDELNKDSRLLHEQRVA